MSDDAEPEQPDPAAAVRTILEEARRVAGGGPRFAARLEEVGVGPPETGRYSESAISNWIRGRTMPPADVLLAAALMAGISVDDRLLVSSRSTAQPPSVVVDTNVLVAAMRAELDDLRSDVIDLYGRLGFPMPTHEKRAASKAPQKRAAAG